MLNVLAWITGALFVADAVLHIIAIAKQKERMRRVTKVLLMPLLAVSFVLFWFAHGTGVLPWLVPLALLMGCAGDTFLLDAHRPALFPLGLASFAVGHVLYMIQMLSILAAPAWWAIALIAAVYLAGTAVIIKTLLPHIPKNLLGAGIFYFLLLCALSVIALSGMLSGFSAGAAVLFAGTLMFLLSDSILAFEVFRGETKNSNIKIMVPYILAQALLAAGFLLLMA